MPPFPGTRSINTSNIPLPEDSADKIFVTLSAHEIATDDERIAFFTALKRSLKPAGQIVVTEHLRDLPNFLAYTIGFFHFLSLKRGKRPFACGPEDCQGNQNHFLHHDLHPGKAWSCSLKSLASC